ncbi:MAG: hypothetical protein QXW84_05065 [Archaeoglobaceae archaeon]
MNIGSSVHDLREAVLCLKTYLSNTFTFELEGSDLLLSFWLIHTFFFDLFSVSPPLVIASARNSLEFVSEDLRLLSKNGKRLFLKSPFIDLVPYQENQATLILENIDEFARKSSRKLLDLFNFIKMSSRKGLVVGSFDKSAGRNVELICFFPKAIVVSSEFLEGPYLEPLISSSVFVGIRGFTSKRAYINAKIVCNTVATILEDQFKDLRIALAKELPKLYGDVWNEKLDSCDPIIAIARICGEELGAEVCKTLVDSEALRRGANKRILYEALKLMKERGLDEIESVELAKYLSDKGLIPPLSLSSPVSIGKALFKNL